MKIHIEGKTYLESDENQYILKRYSGNCDKKTGNETFRSLGYFGTINQAIKSLVNMEIKQSTATSLRELLTEVKSIKSLIDEKINV